MIRTKLSERGIEQDGKYDRWTIIGRPFSNGGGHWLAVAECECGRIRIVDCRTVAIGESHGCRSCRTSALNTTHGEARAGRKSRLYQVWLGMKERCRNPKHKAYKNYGGRGIRVCDEWAASYESFKQWAESSGHSAGLQIDRYPDNNGNYEPSNCRWVTATENSKNRRDNRLIEAFGEVKCVSEWSRDPRCRVRDRVIYKRLNSGWSPERAITSPPRRPRLMVET